MAAQIHQYAATVENNHALCTFHSFAIGEQIVMCWARPKAKSLAKVLGLKPALILYYRSTVAMYVK
jgi:hypothetical protein